MSEFMLTPGTSIPGTDCHDDALLQYFEGVVPQPRRRPNVALFANSPRCSGTSAVKGIPSVAQRPSSQPWFNAAATLSAWDLST